MIHITIPPAAAAFLEGMQWTFFAYFICINLSYLVLTYISVFSIIRYMREHGVQYLPKNFTEYQPPVSVLVPAHNEERTTVSSIRSLLRLGYPNFEIVVVNDGSTDATLDCLLMAQKDDPRIRVIDLSRNFGKEAAMTAGLDLCDADAAIPIDVDLQDPPHVIPQLLGKWREGYEVVLAKRADRSSDGFMKHRSASLCPGCDGPPWYSSSRPSRPWSRPRAAPRPDRKPQGAPERRLATVRPWRLFPTTRTGRGCSNVPARSAGSTPCT